MTDDTANALVLRGRSIRFDENGLACLNDIWKAAGYSRNKMPYDWQRLPGTNAKIERVLELITGKSRNYTLAVAPGGAEQERAYHKRFAAHRRPTA